MDELLDHAAFLVSSRLYPRASRHLCRIGCHSAAFIDSTQFVDGSYALIACERPGCTWTESVPVTHG